jgi:putative ABC transport system permease protein
MSKRKRAGLISENLVIALDVLWAHKLRSGLIILGVAIGVASLMGMVSILLGLQESITRNISSAEQTVLQVQKFDFFVGGFDEKMLHRKEITEEDAEAIRAQCPSLRYVVFVVQPNGPPPTLRYKDEKSRMVQVIGTQPSLLYIQSLDLDEGRMFTDEELYHRSKVVVIGHSPSIRSGKRSGSTTTISPLLGPSLSGRPYSAAWAKTLPWFPILLTKPRCGRNGMARSWRLQ